MDKVFFAYEVPYYVEFKEDLFLDRKVTCVPVGIYKSMEIAQREVEYTLKERDEEWELTYTRAPLVEGSREHVEYKILIDKRFRTWPDSYRSIFITEVTLLG